MPRDSGTCFASGPVHSVEYERGRTRPLAWWVRYPTLEKATKVAQALGNARLVSVCGSAAAMRVT